MTRQEKANGKIDINDLYFGIRLFPGSYSSNDVRELEVYNLFDCYRVKRSVALWVTYSEEEKEQLDFLFFCFGDVHGRAEWEFLVAPLFGNKNECQKTDIYEMYVEPNADYLRKLVDNVAVSTAKKILAEERKRIRERRKRAGER